MSSLLIFLLLLSPPLLSFAAPLTAYEMLEQYDFPVGLLPLGATGFTHNEHTGKFEVFLGETCWTCSDYDGNFKFESTINGIISKDKITNLKGVSTQIFNMWVSVVEVTRQADHLYITAGKFPAATFDIGMFVDSPKCRSKYDCTSATI